MCMQLCYDFDHKTVIKLHFKLAINTSKPWCNLRYKHQVTLCCKVITHVYKGLHNMSSCFVVLYLAPLSHHWLLGDSMTTPQQGVGGSQRGVGVKILMLQLKSLHQYVLQSNHSSDITLSERMFYFILLL